MLNRCYIKLRLVNILEMVFVFIEILFTYCVLSWALYVICVDKKYKNTDIDDETWDDDIWSYAKKISVCTRTR